MSCSRHTTAATSTEMPTYSDRWIAPGNCGSDTGLW